MHMKRIIALLNILALLAFAMAAGLAEPEEPYFRIDRDDPEAWSRELANVRLLTKGRYTLKPLRSRSGEDTGHVPSLEGMDTLNISGSAQYSERQFRDLATTLRECAGDDPIYVVDLRQESHALVNGIALSVYAGRNSANRGMTAAQVEADERQRFGSLPGTTFTAYTSGRNKTPVTIDARTWMAERALAESEGFGYLRIAATDMLWPDAALIDEFIEFVQGLDMDHVWLHFHCQAGFGRTGVFMCIYDMMKNPGVPLEDIVTRQAMTGSEYLLHSWGGTLSIDGDKSKMIRLVYDYIQENRASDYEVRWSDWVKAHTRVEMPNLSDYDVLYLSDNLTVIEQGAYAGTDAQIIVIPKGCTKIRADAFSGAPRLEYIIVPDDAEIFLSPGALSGTDATIVWDTGA